MAGPRDRSRLRDKDRQEEHELQKTQTSKRRSTAGVSNDVGEFGVVLARTGTFSGYDEDSHDDHHHGSPRHSGGQRLDRRFLGACKERLPGISATCREIFAKHWMRILPATVICMLFIWAFMEFRRSNFSAEALDYGLSSQSAMTYIVAHTSATTYITYTAHHAQIDVARPVHHQAPMAVSPDLEVTREATGPDLSNPHVRAPVSGLYFMSMSVTSGGWPQTQQASRPSSCAARNSESSKSVQGSPSLGSSVPEVKPLLLSREIDAPHNLYSGQADVDTTSFTRWGVELLYDLRRSRRSIPFQGRCIDNACSPHKQLNTMCNTSKSIFDSFRRQECEWCWPENQRKHQEINDHCTEVSKRALKAMSVICGIFLFCALCIVAALMLRRRRRAKSGCILRKGATTASPPQITKSVPSRWFSHAMSKTRRYFNTANTRDDDVAIKKRSLGKAVGLIPWYKLVIAKPGMRSGIGPGNPAPGRSGFQKQRTKALDLNVDIGDRVLHERVPVLPPAPPTISSRVFSDIENMGQGTLLSGPGTKGSQHDPQGVPRRSSRQYRCVSSSSEQSASGATYRRDAGAGLYNLQRLTERS